MWEIKTSRFQTLKTAFKIQMLYTLCIKQLKHINTQLKKQLCGVG